VSYRKWRIISTLKNEKKRNAQRKYLKMAKLVRDGRLSKEKFYESYQSWRSHAEQGNCDELIKCFDLKIKNILNGG